MANSTSIKYPAWHTIAYQGVPMFRAHAWAFKDAELHGIPVVINSADRRRGLAERYGKQSQYALYEGFLKGLPNYFPANPPGFSSHELRSDGLAVYRAPRGALIPNYMLGIDVVDHPGGDAAQLVAWFNSHGYRAVRPYNTNSERHHMIFTKSPALNARKRLARYYAKGGK